MLGSFTSSLRPPGGPGSPDPAVARVLLASGPRVEAAVLERAEAIARASWEARRLAAVPSNIKSPAWLADEIVRMGEEAGLQARVWDDEQLRKEGFGGIVAVGQASATPPRLVQLEYTPDGIEALADIAFEVNHITQNIGARRLHTILERVVEDLSFNGPDLSNKHVTIDAKYVRGQLAEIMEKEDLTKFIL